VTADDYLEGAPELVVEIAASSASYDLGKKKRIYARNGVQEYIVFVAYERQIHWFVLGEEGYEVLSTDVNGILRSKIFPGLWLHSEALRSGDLAKMLAVVQEGIASPEHMAFMEQLAQNG
jgi:Uma2 family endonuclease